MRASAVLRAYKLVFHHRMIGTERKGEGQMGEADREEADKGEGEEGS